MIADQPRRLRTQLPRLIGSVALSLIGAALSIVGGVAAAADAQALSDSGSGWTIVSLKILEWDASASELRGRVDSIAGADYTFYIHVPVGTRLVDSMAVAAKQLPVALRVRQDKEAMAITLAGQVEPVDWTLRFAVTHRATIGQKRGHRRSTA